jgi:hypothetical protein
MINNISATCLLDCEAASTQALLLLSGTKERNLILGRRRKRTLPGLWRIAAGEHFTTSTT